MVYTKTGRGLRKSNRVNSSQDMRNHLTFAALLLVLPRFEVDGRYRADQLHGVGFHQAGVLLVPPRPLQVEALDPDPVLGLLHDVVVVHCRHHKLPGQRVHRDLRGERKREEERERERGGGGGGEKERERKKERGRERERKSVGERKKREREDDY